jgi:PAS domain S-box-containing protein
LMPEAGKPPVELRKPGIRIIRTLGILGWVATVLIAVATPVVYFAFAIKEERESLQIETAYTAKAIQSIIFARPELWEYETTRLLEIASIPTIRNDKDERAIYDDSGKIVVVTKYKAPAESITSTVPLFVSGYEAGFVRAKRSVSNILWGTVFAAILGSIFGFAIYFYFKSFPLRLLKEALTGLAAEKEKTETTLSSIGDGVITVDREGRIAYMNPVAEMCTGWRSKEVLGRNLRDCYVTREDGKGMGSDVHAPCTLLSRNGEKRTIEEVWSPIKDRDSAEEGHVIVFRDVTEKWNLERQLQQAQKMESLGVLAGGIAHDFNNLLMAIMGHAELALEGIPPSSPARRDLTGITTATQRAADLCRQMLAYAGKASFALERVGLGELVEEMTHLLKTSISKKAILVMNLERGLPPIKADPSQIRQIVMNLIINASEAIGDRNGKITVSMGAMPCDREYLRGTELHVDLVPGLYVYIEVADTGVGMDARTQSRIFEPFFSTKFTGRGLGLSAVLGIVRAHKGALKVYSEPGKGTTFKVFFPALEEAKEKEGFPESSRRVEWRGKGTILLVDDEESLLGLGSRMLEYLGFTVLTAADGLEAVEVYRQRGKEIDLVLMDLTMPRMDGAKAFDELRLLNPEVRVVLASGYNKEDVASRIAGKDPDGILQKPYTLANLKESLAGRMPARTTMDG